MPRNSAARGIIDSVEGQRVGAATVDVADPGAMVDQNIAMLSVDANGRLRVVLTGSAGVPQSVVAVPFSTTSLGNTGRATTPGAAGVIVTIAAPPAGLYDVYVFTNLDLGVPVAAAETNNMQFLVGAGVISVLSVLPVINIYGPAKRFRCVLTGAQALTVQAVGAATAGVGYNAEIIATRVQ